MTVYKLYVCSLTVIPAQAGIHCFRSVLDSRRSLPSNVFIGGGNDRQIEFVHGG